LTAGLLMRGTDTPAFEINDALESVGARFAFAAAHTVGFGGKPRRGPDLLLDILAAVCSIPSGPSC
jgi:hypothetical protein